MSASHTKQIGIVTIGRKRPGFDQQWNEVMRREAAAALAALAIPTAGGRRSRLTNRRCAPPSTACKPPGCTTLLVLQPSMGNGQLALTVAQRWRGPVVLWATPERPDGEKVSSCSLVAQHLWASLLRQLNRPFELVIRSADRRRRRSDHSCAPSPSPAPTPKSARRALGLIGTHAPGFIAMEADPFALQQQLGVQLQRLSLPQFIERVRGVAKRPCATTSIASAR